MTALTIERLQVAGFKTIQQLDLELRPINVLIGANGAGKSNLISLFTLMNRIARESLQLYVAQAGGADALLYYGRKTTDQLKITIWFRQTDTLRNGYACTLVPTDDDRLIFAEETIFFHDCSAHEKPYDVVKRHPHPESWLPGWKYQGEKIAAHVLSAMHSWQVYHFHDTGPDARVKKTGNLHDNERLHPDASNLAAFLYRLRETHPRHYRAIVETVRLAAPFFEDFVLRPNPLNPETIRLEWRDRGSDEPFGPHMLSDGTLRFICLATLLLQPAELRPSTIVLDEPELGLHPYAIALLSDMVRKAASQTQVFLATQSVTLINQFDPEDLIVVDRTGPASTFRRLSADELSAWLEEYSLGDLWEKNVLGGRPS